MPKDYANGNFIARLVNFYKRYGLIKVLRKIIVRLINRLAVIAFKKSTNCFEFGNSKLHYFSHPYNTTWANERAVELPIVWDIVRRNKTKRILEVGNVLSHYFDFNHDVIDKYEKAEGVMNKDIIDYNPSTKYDLIVSVSTVEHIGFNERPIEPKKVLETIQKLKKIKDKSGAIVITFPLGHNLYIDEYLKNERLDFDNTYFFKRKGSIMNEWREIRREDVEEYFGKVIHPKKVLVIGIIGSGHNIDGL